MDCEQACRSRSSVHWAHGEDTGAVHAAKEVNCFLSSDVHSGVSNHWTGFSTGTWDWNVRLEHGTGMWDRNL